MGHERLGYLPKTKRWRDLVQNIASESEFSESSVISDLSKQTLDLLRTHFEHFQSDTSLAIAIKFLARISRNEFKDTTTKTIDINSNEATPIRLAICLRKELERGKVSKEYAEIALASTCDALGKWYSENSGQQSLFDESESNRVWRRANTAGAFSDITRYFFSSLICRYLRYYWDREASSTIPSISSRQRLDAALEITWRDIAKNAYETTKITQSFAAGWFEKQRKNTKLHGTSIDKFIRIAFGKLQEELRREGSTI